MPSQFSPYRALHTYGVQANKLKHNRIILRKPLAARQDCMAGRKELRDMSLRRLLGLRALYGENCVSGTVLIWHEPYKIKKRQRFRLPSLSG